MKKKVFLPRWLWEGVKPLKNSFPKRYKLIVFDTETESATTGDPYLLVFYDGEKPEYIKVTPEVIADEFFLYMDRKCSKHCPTVLFAHNLQFDLTAMVTSREKEAFVWLTPPPLVHPLGEVRVFPQKTWFAQIRLKNGAYVKVVDSANFIMGSLYDVSRILNLEHKKRHRPKFVEEGRKPRNKAEWRELLRYCCDEIKAEYDLAKFILDIHKRYNVGFCVSTSHLASKAFRKHFLKETIPQAPPWVRNLAELSIHGGRASCFSPAPVVIPNVKMYDYNSFYPWAMTRLPPFTKGKWVRVNCFNPEHEGFYIINGYVKPCKYPIILKNPNNFEFANGERIEEVVIASPELREAIRCGEFVPERIEGWVWIPSKDAENPFNDYVEEFYRLKQNTPNDNPLHVTYKLLLNGIYGKTYQALRHTDYEEEADFVWNERLKKPVKNKILYRAGGIYLPHVGALITSMCRAKLHADLHKYNAIDCATDSFKARKRVKQGGGLGELKLVCEGLLLLIRPKLYIMFSMDVQKVVLEAYGGDLREFLKENLDSLEVGKDIIKYALHGFRGNVIELLRLYRDKSNEYIAKPHMTKIRESIRQRKQPRVMETKNMEIKIPWKNEIMPCKLTIEEALKRKELCVAPRCYECAYVREF